MLRVVAIGPPPSLDVAPILAFKPSAVLIDHQLGDVQPGETRGATYLGATLAAALREKLPVSPLILLTRRSMFKGPKRGAALDLAGVFDQVHFKEEVYEDPAAFRRELVRLVDGFAALQKNRRGWRPLLEALGAEEGEAAQLRKAEPPERLFTEEYWRVTEAARWVHSSVLRYPGIVYDDAHAAAAMGLSRESFLSKSVQTFLRPAKYVGVFEPDGGRWWAGRLFELVLAALRAAKMQDAAPARFADAWNKGRRNKIVPATCNSSGAQYADAVCFLLREPVLKELSLPYYPDSRPACMDVARVSFKAIRETFDYNEEWFPADSRVILRRLEAGDDVR